MPIRTVGHGTLSADAFSALLSAAGLEEVVDIRSYPGSRHNPQYNREAMEGWLPDAGLTYHWIRDLGGRRRGAPNSPNVALRNEAFRGYADHMATATFATGIEQLLAEPAVDRTVVMCSESVWWRCHRRLLADHLVLVREIDVMHLMHDGRQTPHAVTDGARRAADHVVYDLGVTSALDLEDA
jgi:uncharacterized protein (DUF488 family)